MTKLTASEVEEVNQTLVRGEVLAPVAEEAKTAREEQEAAQHAAQLTAEAAYAWRVIAHTSPGQHYPNVFDDQNAVYAIPEGVEYTLLYQVTAGNAYTLKEYPLDKSQLDWTTFGEP